MTSIALSWLPFGLALYISRLPAGDGHPVMVMPGFLAQDTNMAVMREVLKRKNYRVYSADLKGMNIPVNPKAHLNALEARLEDVSRRNGGRKVSLVGWSLGGMQARELAKLRPDLVRQVISLGSPLGVHHKQGGTLKALGNIGEFITQGNLPPDPFFERIEGFHEAPPVPTTAIYSRNDGVAHWLVDLQEKKNPDAPAQNIEVRTSHAGMCYDWPVIYAVADRLAQLEGGWRPFDHEALPPEIRWLFPEPVPVKDSAN